MTSATPQWEKENIRLYEREAADREFLRIVTERGSDSDVLREALRVTEQFVEDIEQQKFLSLTRNGAGPVKILPEQFKDSASDEVTIRRSLVLHQASRARLDDLQQKLELPDISAVARFALRFFAFIAREASAGAQFAVTDQHGSEVQIRFGFARASRSPAQLQSDKLATTDGEPLPSRTAPKRQRQGIRKFLHATVGS